MKQVNSNFSVTALLDGSSITARLSVLQGSLVQFGDPKKAGTNGMGIKPSWISPIENGAPVYDGDKRNKAQPVIALKIIDLNGNGKIADNVEWFYNGEKITFGADGISNNGSCAKKFRLLNGAIGEPADKNALNVTQEYTGEGGSKAYYQWPALQIIDNLIHVNNVDNDIIEASGQIKYNGSTINIAKLAEEIILKDSSGSLHVLFLHRDHEISTGNLTSTITADLWYDGEQQTFPGPGNPDEKDSKTYGDKMKRWNLRWFEVKADEIEIQNPTMPDPKKYEIINKGGVCQLKVPAAVVNGDVRIKCEVRENVKTGEGTYTPAGLNSKVLAFDYVDVEDKTDPYNINFSFYDLKNFAPGSPLPIEKVEADSRTPQLKSGQAVLIVPRIYNRMSNTQTTMQWEINWVLTNNNDQYIGRGSANDWPGGIPGLSADKSVKEESGQRTFYKAVEKMSGNKPSLQFELLTWKKANDTGASQDVRPALQSPNLVISYNDVSMNGMAINGYVWATIPDQYRHNDADIHPEPAP